MVLSVMEGFEIDLREKILGSNAHVVALSFTGYFGKYGEKADQVAALEEVEAASPFLYTEAMVRSSWGNAGVILKGLDPQRTAGVTDVVSNLTIGPLGEVSDPEEQREILETLHEPPRGITQADDDTDVLPGMIIFGVVGFLCLILSLVLSQQSFVVPSNVVEQDVLFWNLASLLSLFAVVGVLAFLAGVAILAVSWADL